MLVRRGDPEVVRSVADNQVGAVVRRRLLRPGPARGRRRRSWPRRSGSGRTFRRICSAICCARDRGGAAAAAGGGQAGDPGRDPARARQGFQGIQHQSAPARDYTAAQRTVLGLHQSGQARRDRTRRFRQVDKKYEETVAALSVLCGVPIETADRLMAATGPIRCSFSARRPATAGRPRARSSWRARRQGHVQPGARRGLLPISRSCRPRPRSAWCGSGRCGKRTTRNADGVPACSLSPEDQIAGHAALALWPWPRSACRKSPATAAASRRRARRSRRNPARARDARSVQAA